MLSTCLLLYEANGWYSGGVWGCVGVGAYEFKDPVFYSEDQIKSEIRLDWMNNHIRFVVYTL